MIVLPCGFPSVFAVPSILNSRTGFPERSALMLVFLAASVLPLAAVGVGLGFAGDAVLGLLDTMGARMGFAVVLYSLIGIVALAYALSELGLFNLSNPLSRFPGPNMPGADRPYGRSLVLGSTMGAGMGIGCPMPTYYIVLGWVAAGASPLYGAIVLGIYGLGRVLPAVGLGAQEVLRAELPVLVDFWAEWCGPCHALEPVVEELAGEYDGKVKFVKMDTEQNFDIPARYGQHSIAAVRRD